MQPEEIERERAASLLAAIRHTSKFKIMKDDVDIYNAEKHRLPCWNCENRPTCFSEKKAANRAKYLRYTVEFKKPCIESILAMDIINMAISNLLTRPLNEIDDMNISELFEYAVNAFLICRDEWIDDLKFGPTMYAMFISVTQRDPNISEEDFLSAYYYLGNIFRKFFNEIDHAIDLYSKAIELKPDAEILEYRGWCYYCKNDYKNALNDFKKAVQLDGNYLHRLAHKIKECESLLYGEIDPAIDLYCKAIDFKAENPEFSWQSGLDYYCQKDYKNALNNFKKAVQIHKEYLHHLADITEECEKMI